MDIATLAEYGAAPARHTDSVQSRSGEIYCTAWVLVMYRLVHLCNGDVQAGASVQWRCTGYCVCAVLMYNGSALCSGDVQKWCTL